MEAKRIIVSTVVLILILLEVTQIQSVVIGFEDDDCLNPYSTGSNSNSIIGVFWSYTIERLNPYSTGSNSNINLSQEAILIHSCLNPYSTGSNSNSAGPEGDIVEFRLNPYSTGSNSNYLVCLLLLATKVLILILLEVTQIGTWGKRSLKGAGLNPYSTGSNSNKQGRNFISIR